MKLLRVSENKFININVVNYIRIDKYKNRWDLSIGLNSEGYSNNCVKMSANIFMIMLKKEYPFLYEYSYTIYGKEIFIFLNILNCQYIKIEPTYEEFKHVVFNFKGITNYEFSDGNLNDLKKNKINNFLNKHTHVFPLPLEQISINNVQEFFN
jgi:hypothetical protein